MALRDSPSAAAVWRAACEKFCAGVVGGKIHRYLPPAWLADDRAADWMGRRTRFMSAAAITYARECSEQAQVRVLVIQKGTRVLISLWDSLMFGRVPKNGPA